MHTFRSLLAVVICCLSCCGTVLGQPVPKTASSVPKAAATPADIGEQVVVKRESLQLIDPQEYKIPIQLEPAKQHVLVAPFDGVVQEIKVPENAEAAVRVEVIRLDNTVEGLKARRAQALLRAAQLELKRIRSSGGDADAVAAAEARVEAADADAKLAEHLLDKTSIRAPFAGRILRLDVISGQFVRGGQALGLLADPQQMSVEIPVERKATEIGQAVSLKVEGTEVEGKVENIVPLHERFAPLRDLFESVASARVVVDNANGRFQTGQSVYIPLIPRQTVAEIPSSALANDPEAGEQKVQVVRDDVVRDVQIQLLASIGPERLYVSGSFSPGDEVIYESSHPLLDGTQLQRPGDEVSSGSRPGGRRQGLDVGDEDEIRRPPGYRRGTRGF